MGYTPNIIINQNPSKADFRHKLIMSPKCHSQINSLGLSTEFLQAGGKENLPATFALSHTAPLEKFQENIWISVHV